MQRVVSKYNLKISIFYRPTEKMCLKSYFRHMGGPLKGMLPAGQLDPPTPPLLPLHSGSRPTSWDAPPAHARVSCPGSRFLKGSHPCCRVPAPKVCRQTPGACDLP